MTLLFSILAKTLALALLTLQPWLALLLWLAGLAADLLAARGQANVPGCGRFASHLKNVLLLNLAALLVGWSVAEACGYAAMRWKDGIPAFAGIVAGLLDLTGMTAAAHQGVVHRSTMAGPLEFTISIDEMALKVPALFAALSLVALLAGGGPLRGILRKILVIIGILLLASLARMTLVILLADSIFDFTGYESEELPYRPFMDEAARVWVHLPFLLVACVPLGRLLGNPASWAAGPAVMMPRSHLAAGACLLLFAFLVFREPTGTRKDGRIVLSSHHAQWSRADRPYDRDWYGADSGYNYACLKRLFGLFRPVVEAQGPLAAADLEGASVLVIHDPDRRFGKGELERVRDFVRGGGGLLLIGDHTNVFGSTSHLNEVSEPFGFQFRDDVLFDLDEDFHQLLERPARGSSFWHGMTFFKLRGPASIRPTSWWTRNAYQVGHAKSVRAIYSVNNFYPPPHDHPRMKSGTFSVAAASRYGRGRVAAWADSTVFSNFEIFYPGKYEYLLNTLNWLDHKDSLISRMVRRVALLAWWVLAAGMLLRFRGPRAWLLSLVMLCASVAIGRHTALWFEQRTAEFPKPARPSEWLFFAADSKDPGHHLRDFVGAGPYDQRYEVFIQWVLRTGGYPAFWMLDHPGRNGLYDHLRKSGQTRTGIGLIVRKPEDLEQLSALKSIPAGPEDPLLLMFASSIPMEQAIKAIQQAKLFGDAIKLDALRAAWPSGEVLIEDGRRRVMVVAGAERFSDQMMGITEKVVPDEPQRALFDKAFSLSDRLFGRENPED